MDSGTGGSAGAVYRLFFMDFAGFYMVVQNFTVYVQKVFVLSIFMGHAWFDMTMWMVVAASRLHSGNESRLLLSIRLVCVHWWRHCSTKVTV